MRPDGTPAPSGQEGELRVKSPQMMLGYTDPALVTDAFDDHGRFRTGDLGVVEPSGVVRITGRLKDIIIRKMENVSAQEVEELLSIHPAVADVAVVGIPDQRCGERVCAVIVAADHRNPPEPRRPRRASAWPWPVDAQAPRAARSARRAAPQRHGQGGQE